MVIFSFFLWKDSLLDLGDAGAVELDESDLNEDVAKLRCAVLFKVQ